VKRLLETFKKHDEKRLFDDYKYYTDLEKLRANALTAAVELEELFARDVEELPDEDGVPVTERPAERVSAEPRDGRGSAG
jgi:glutathione-regulated potassium-efflux system protein KefB